MFEDIVYDKPGDGIAVITINRPDVMNALRQRTIEELLEAFRDVWSDRSIGAVVLTGAGERAFCTGGDQSDRADGGYGRAARSDTGHDIEELHSIMRDSSKPVIAAVNGYAIGGGHVLHVLCDLTVAGTTARFGQVGPKVGSVDPGFGTAYLVRLIGEKRAREMWYLCRQYDAATALDIGLVNAVVEPADVVPTASAWAREIAEKSPTAITMAKAAFNAASEHIRGFSALGYRGLALFYETEESLEGVRAFREKRPPDFTQFRR